MQKYWWRKRRDNIYIWISLCFFKRKYPAIKGPEMASSELIHNTFKGCHFKCIFIGCVTTLLLAITIVYNGKYNFNPPAVAYPELYVNYGSRGNYGRWSSGDRGYTLQESGPTVAHHAWTHMTALQWVEQCSNATPRCYARLADDGWRSATLCHPRPGLG